ncbi:MAG: methylmalonyl-CoA mutase, partial [Chloroflexota bacterium]
AYRTQQALEKGEEILVGVNAFQVEEKSDLERLEVNPAIEVGQRARLEKLRGERDTAKVSALLSLVEETARGTQNLMPIFVECVENDITLGEITGVLRGVWGEYQSSSWF